MKPTFSGCPFLAVFCLLGLFVTVAKPQDRQSTHEIHVLFIGNSFTYVNDLPKMVAELAKAGKQRPLRYDQETPGGCTLEKHWKDGKALAKIQPRQWDFVVLQDQSQAALIQRESMFDYGKKLNAEITKKGSKTILYMTWAFQNQPADQATITKAYQELGKELNAKVAPVGNAWEMALKADQHLVLHDPDKKHPTQPEPIWRRASSMRPSMAKAPKVFLVRSQGWRTTKPVTCRLSHGKWFKPPKRDSDKPLLAFSHS